MTSVTVDVTVHPDDITVYGAVPGDTGDQTAAIQAAIDAAAAAGTVQVRVPDGVFRHTGTLNVPATVELVGEGDGSVLHYTGTGVGVNLRGQRAGLRRIKVRVSGTATAAVEVDATSTPCTYWRCREVTISGDTRTSGTVGLRMVNTPTTSIYYGDTDGLLIENFGTGLQIAADPTYGINANRFASVKIHNCDTAVDVGAGNGNIFTNLLADLFTTGIVCNGVRNQFIGVRVEGGGGDTAYTFGDGAQENLLVGTAQTGSGSSTDHGTDNQVWLQAAGAVKPWDQQTKWVAPFDPLLADADGTVPFGAGGAQLVKLSGVERTQAFTQVRFEVTVQGGHISVALYELTGTTLVRLATTGVIVCPAVGGRFVTLSPAVTLRPDRIYYAGLAADSTAARFKSRGGVSGNLLDITSPNVTGRQLYAFGGTSMPMPATLDTRSGSTDAKCFALILR